MTPRGEHRLEPARVPEVLEARAGTYALVLPSEGNIQLRVGRLGRVHIEPGVYVYVGSALGSGGVRARVVRHLGPVAVKHWHIDYLRDELRVSRVIYAYSKRRLEHAWATALMRLGVATIPADGFGASDCRCQSHLIFFQGWPDRAQFAEVLRGASPRDTILHQLLIA